MKDTGANPIRLAPDFYAFYNKVIRKHKGACPDDTSRVSCVGSGKARWQKRVLRR